MNPKKDEAWIGQNTKGKGSVHEVTNKKVTYQYIHGPGHSSNAQSLPLNVFLKYFERGV